MAINEFEGAVNPFAGDEFAGAVNPFENSISLKDTVSAVSTDPDLAGTEMADKIKTVSFLQQKGVNVDLTNIDAMRPRLFSKDSSYSAINRQLTNELSVQSSGPATSVARTNRTVYDLDAFNVTTTPEQDRIAEDVGRDSALKQSIKKGVGELAQGSPYSNDPEFMKVADKVVQKLHKTGEEIVTLGKDYEQSVDAGKQPNSYQYGAWNSKQDLGYSAAGNDRDMLQSLKDKDEQYGGNAPEQRPSFGGKAVQGFAGSAPAMLQSIALSPTGVGPSLYWQQQGAGSFMRTFVSDKDIDSISSGDLKRASDISQAWGVPYAAVELAVRSIPFAKGMGSSIDKQASKFVTDTIMKMSPSAQKAILDQGVAFTTRWLLETVEEGVQGGITEQVRQQLERENPDLAKILDVSKDQLIGAAGTTFLMTAAGAGGKVAFDKARDITGFNGGPLTTDDIATLREQPELLDNLEPSEQADRLRRAVIEGDGSAQAEYNQNLVGVEEVAPIETESQQEFDTESLTESEVKITNDADNILREEYGIDPTATPEVRTHASLIQESVESDRDVNTLLDDLKNKPRPLEDFESADIAREKARISASLRLNKQNLQEAIEAGDADAIAKYSIEKSSLVSRLADFTNTARLAKTETGRALSAIRLSINATKDLTDHIHDATVNKGETLTDKEVGSIEKSFNKVDEVQAKIETKKNSTKSLDEKIKELTENIEQAKRTIKKQKTGEQSQKQQKINQLKEIERDQDTIFELLKQLNEQKMELSKPAMREDPEGYKTIIKNLLDMRKNSQWYKDLKANPNKDNQRRIALLDDTLNNLEAQQKGKFRDIKEKKTEVTPAEIADLQNKINYVKEIMRVEDKIAVLDEETRMIIEGKESPKTTRVEREAERFVELEALYNELAHKQKQLISIKENMGTGNIIKAMEFQRAFKLSLDSWLLRQGGQTVLSNPFTTLDAWFKSFAGFNEDSFHVQQRAMEQSESFKKSRDMMGVEYMDLDGGFNEHQEAVHSSLAERIPPVAGSNRHMVSGVNQLRWNLSRKFLNKFPDESLEFYQAGGHWINNLTGRGTLTFGKLGNLENSARGLTAFLTAPRYTKAKWHNIINIKDAWIDDGSGKKTLNKKLLKEITAQKARMYSGYAMIATGMIAMGWEPEWDAEDSEFMKLRNGDMVIDIAPHMTGEMKLIALYMESVAANMGVGELEADSNKNVWDRSLAYAGYKVSPSIATMAQLGTGQTVVGEERTPIETIALAVAPIMAEGIYQDAIKDNEEMSDMTQALIWQFIGAGANLYEDKEESRSSRKRNSDRKDRKR